MSVRAGLVIIGTEVLTGRVTDRNGPWLADRLLELGVELAHTTICGDRRADIEAQLRFLARQGMDLVITSGGLGPTADDLTVEVVAGFAGRELELDEGLEQRIGDIIAPLASRWPDVTEETFRDGTAKQATVPAGATVLEPVGTAPGVVVTPSDGSGPTVVVLPGPPRELQAMWTAALATAELSAVLARAGRFQQRMLRLFGIPESAIAITLRDAEQRIDGLERLEITTCLRRGEVEVVVRHDPEDAAAYDALARLVGERHPRALFSSDGSRVDDQVAELLSGRRLAVAESCTGGLLAARITERPGSSAYFSGGLVTYADGAKASQVDVDPDLIRRHGAVSPQVADAMAAGALARLDADVAVAITGVAGPGGGTEAKPVGYVCWSARRSDGEPAALARDFRVPGDRAEVRDRSTTVAMHLLRSLLRGEQPV